MRRLPVSGTASILAVFVWSLAVAAMAEIVYLKNGDVLHGTVVSVHSAGVALQTPYGRLNIPKNDIERIEYDGGQEVEGEGPPDEKVREAEGGEVLHRSATGGAGPVLSLDIRGRSFWHAFESPPENPADLSIRLRLFVGEKEAAMLLDSKPDTYDKHTYYNSFTFSPSDSKVVRTGSGFGCRIIEADDGRVVLTLDLPNKQREGRHMVRMLYQVNEASAELPRWVDAVSRSFSVEVENGKETYVVLEQDASGLDYSGFFRKSMKNLESFELNVLSSELKNPATELRP